MSPDTIGRLAGGLVIISFLPYMFRVYQGKIRPNLTSWSLWVLIGLALLITYKGVGAEANAWPVFFGLTNPLIITLLILRQGSHWSRMGWLDIFCAVTGVMSLIIWYGVRESRELAQYALYLAMLADFCAAIPTVNFAFQQPQDDRPFAWVVFALAYFLAMFAITEQTIANYVLPIYMFLGCMFIAWPLMAYRYKNKIPLKEWI